MSRGKNVSWKVQQKIGEVAERNLSLKHFEIRDEVARIFEGEDEYIPGPDAIGKIARKARNFKEHEDQDWSIGASGYAVSPEALPTVLAVWRRCVIKGSRFTVRQAKWVGRLRDLKLSNAGEDHIEELYVWSGLYAGREKVNLALSKPEKQPRLDTSDMDALLAFDGAVYHAVVGAGLVPSWSYEKRIEALEQGAPERATHEKNLILTGGPRDVEAWRDIDAMMDEAFEGLRQPDRQEAYEVWEAWLTAFSKRGKRWRERGSTGLIVALAEEVAQYFKSRPTFSLEIQPPFRPSKELLDEVSFERKNTIPKR